MDFQVINKPYIYLDWNVFKYIKEPKTDTHRECLQLFENLKKKYVFPYCYAHILDRANKFSEDYRNLVEDDLKFVEKLTENHLLAESSTGEILVVKSAKSSIAFFNKVIADEQSKKHTPISHTDVPMDIFAVDMKKIKENHPLKGMLEKTNGIIGPGILANHLSKLQDLLFSEIIDYKNIRSYMLQLNEDIKNNINSRDLQAQNVLRHFIPLLESFEILDESLLKQKWKDITIELLKYSGKYNVFGEQITTAYTILDLHPNFNEKLKKHKNTLSNITRDSKNLFYASSARYLVSEDENYRDKAKFIYDAFDINIKVTSMAEVLQKFTI